METSSNPTPASSLHQSGNAPERQAGIRRLLAWCLAPLLLAALAVLLSFQTAATKNAREYACLRDSLQRYGQELLQWRDAAHQKALYAATVEKLEALCLGAAEQPSGTARMKATFNALKMEAMRLPLTDTVLQQQLLAWVNITGAMIDQAEALGQCLRDANAADRATDQLTAERKESHGLQMEVLTLQAKINRLEDKIAVLTRSGTGQTTAAADLEKLQRELEAICEKEAAALRKSFNEQCNEDIELLQAEIRSKHLLLVSTFALKLEKVLQNKKTFDSIVPEIRALIQHYNREKERLELSSSQVSLSSF